MKLFNNGFCYFKKVGDGLFECIMCKNRIQTNCNSIISKCKAAKTEEKVNSVYGDNMDIAKGEGKFTVTDNEIFNNGMCWFEPTGKPDEFRCVVCGQLTVSKSREKILIVRPCQTPKTRSQILSDNGIKIPSLARRLGNFGIAVLKHMATGAKPATREEIDYRYSICNDQTGRFPTCIYFDGKNEICMACGCKINTLLHEEGLNKLAWKESRCVKGFWDSIK